jgi:replicative DNA helicase
MLPHDLDAEAVVLSAILLAGERLYEVQGFLRPQDFYSDANCWVYRAVEAVQEETGTVDIVSVASWLRTHERLHQVGGTPYLAQLTDAIPATAHLEVHGKRVAELAYLRRLINTFKALAAEGYHAKDPVDFGQRAEQRVFEQARFVVHEEEDHTLAGVVARVFEDITAKYRGEPPSAESGGIVIPTGIVALDEKLGGGWKGGNKYVIGGRPGMGKSAFVLQCMVAAARYGYAGILVSAEMPVHQIAVRLLAQETGVTYRRLDSGDLRDEDWTLVTGQIERVRGLPISLVYIPGATKGDVRAAVRRELAKLRKVHGAQLELGIIGIDHIHIMNAEREPGESAESAISRLSKSSLWMAGEFKCAVLELAQLNRAVEKKPDKRPGLDDLRQSGSLEEDAYAVVFPFRPAYYDKDRNQDDTRDDVQPDKAEIILAKHRNGSTGSVEVVFHGPTLRFYGLEHGGGL